MTGQSKHRALSLSRRLYGYLLYLYPSEFRARFGPEMAQTFDALCVHTFEEYGWTGLRLLWRFALRDAAVSAAGEQYAVWRIAMRKKNVLSVALGSIFLIYSAAFAAINVLKYNVGLSAMWNPYEAIVNGPQPSPVTSLLNGLIIAGPALALGLYLMPLITVNLENDERLASIVIYRAGGVTRLLLGICILVGVLFLVYATLENLPCLLGRAITC